LVRGSLILPLMTVIMLRNGYAMQSFLGLDIIPSQHFFDLLREQPPSTPIV
jgi:hypothetical protein